MLILTQGQLRACRAPLLTPNFTVLSASGLMMEKHWIIALPRFHSSMAFVAMAGICRDQITLYLLSRGLDRLLGDVMVHMAVGF